jgi:hypothetical protein
MYADCRLHSAYIVENRATAARIHGLVYNTNIKPTSLMFPELALPFAPYCTVSE